MNEKFEDYSKADLKQPSIVFYNKISAGHTSLLQVYRCNICKPEEGWYGQPKYCYKKQYTLF